jgi:outer membrane protein assembly factor BamD
LLKQDVEAEMIIAYKEGMKELEKGEALYASRKFDEAEILFPQSIWAAKASLMSAYALYSQNYYDDTIFNLERHIKNYPKDKDLVYAHYLIAICYFEQLHDEKKDLKPLVKAREKFEYILKKYPNTDYAIDAKWKMGLIVDQMAAKEMYIGRYYMKMEKWIAAINRFKFVVKYYDTTVYIEEALHRLVEIYYKIGLIEDAQKVAATLGYNYGSGEWYKNSYRIFNKSYKTAKTTKKKKDSFIRKKFKKLFE